MKRRLDFWGPSQIPAILAITFWTILSPSAGLALDKPSTWEVYFSPHGGCTEAIVRELNIAKSSILVQAYSLTSAPIAKALLNAHMRGVKVEVVLDKSQETERYSSATFLLHGGIPVKIDAQHAIAHSKVMVIDGEIVITGSFNFTKAAEQNNEENLVVLSDKRLAEQYAKHWQEHADHSETYAGRSPR